MEDEIRYDLLTQDALRGVVREVLTQVQRNGLPGRAPPLYRLRYRRRGRLGLEAPERAVSRGNDDRPAVPVLGPAGDERALRGEAVLLQRARAAGGAVQRGQGVLRSLGPVRAPVRQARRGQRLRPPAHGVRPARSRGRAWTKPRAGRTSPKRRPRCRPPKWSCRGRRPRSCSSTASARNSHSLSVI